MITPEKIRQLEARFTVKQFAKQMNLDERLLDLIIEHDDEHWSRSLTDWAVVSLKARLPCHELAQYHWPKTWWDAVKERFAPKWAFRPSLFQSDRRLRWYWRLLLSPVQYDSVRIDAILCDPVFSLNRDRIDLRFAVTNGVGELSKEPQHEHDERMLLCQKCGYELDVNRIRARFDAERDAR